jgi:ubiquinone/menaquinone biosynthesis C-methylase UbiE
MSSAMQALGYVIRHPRRALYNLRRGKGFSTRYVFDVENVAPQGPMGNVMAYLDRRIIRACLTDVTRETKVRRALEVGCGYGRLIMTLAEFADEVIGVEREPHLVATAKALLPDVQFRQQSSILSLPTVHDASVDFAMTFTVLQHMVDDDVRVVLAELRRVVRPGGFVLVCEKVEPGNETERQDDRTLYLSKHRPVDVYAEWMRPFAVHSVRPRPAPASWNRNSGVAMLFRRES